MNQLEKTFSDMENTSLSFLHSNESIWTGEKFIEEITDVFAMHSLEICEHG